MTNEEIYEQMQRIRVKKNKEIKTKETYELLKKRIDDLVGNLKMSQGFIVEIQDKSRGVKIDSKNIGDDQMSSIKNQMVSVIEEYKSISNKIDLKIQEQISLISSLERQYKTLSLQCNDCIQ